MVSITSTGLSAQRRRLEAAAMQLGVKFSGDLTDVTTHLVTDDIGRQSAKLQCARRLGLPVVRPAWLYDSCRAGQLLDSSKYMLGEAQTETRERRVAKHCASPVRLLARAVEEHDAAVCGPAEDTAASMRLGECSFVRAATTPLQRADGEACYTLDELLFALRQAHLSHAEYFIACLHSRPYVAPMLVADKQALFDVCRPLGVSSSAA
jgi:hypothetical protein